MTLRMIVGRANVDKSDYIMEEIKRELRAEPDGPPIFYIVPEQMTFQQEYQLFQEKDVNGSTRAQVVSFSRLSFRVLQETGGATKQFITSTGIQMMLRKIMEERVDDFAFFQKAADKNGFIKELDGMITEFKRHSITPEMLGEQLTYTKENIPLQQKLTDLLYVYEQLVRVFAGKYIDGEDQLTLLAQKIEDTALFKDAMIYVDGFHRFSPNELAVLSALLGTAKQVSVTLTMEATELAFEATELDLFYQTRDTYSRLVEMAKQQEVLVQAPVVALEPFVRLTNQYMTHLEKHFDVRPAPILKIKHTPPLHVREAIHPRAELDGVIQEVLRLTREDGYRFRDMVIYVRDQEAYYDLIQSLFHDYQIPVFIDEKRTMLHHPFIELIRSLFECITSNWRYDAVFRLLKTGFIQPTDDKYPLTMDAIDKLENYVLEYGIKRKSQWLQAENWHYQRFQGFTDATQTDQERKMEERINRYRRQVVAVLRTVDEQLRKAKTIQARCEVLYLFVERLHIPEQLERNRNLYDDGQQLERAREEEQVWEGFTQLLDEMVEMIGEETLALPVFTETFEAGLEALEFSHVPPSMDQIIVASIDHSRIEGKKCSFLLGVNEGSWPMKPPLDGLINEHEREFLKQFGLELAISSRRELLDDMFYMYLAFTTASDYMWVSYCLSNHEGEKQTPSQMVHRLCGFFPTLGRPRLLQDPDELTDAERFITTPQKTRAALTSQLARAMRAYPMSPVWHDVLLWYMKHEDKQGTTFQVLQSLFYQNKPVHLQGKTVEALYPGNVKTSVSRLETLYRCSYQHFVKYNLRLEDRRTYKLDAPDIGQLFHEAIKTITEWMHKDGRDFAVMTREESAQYAAKSMHHLAPALNHHILASSNRYHYIKRKLRDVIARATYMLSEQARLSGFSPVGIELGFGLGQGLEPVKIPLSNGYEILLRGRIDRVDQSTEYDQLFLRIIDYKSSSRGLDLSDVYYGLALQMLTYLHVVLTQAEDWLGMKASPAGILYFHVHDAMLKEEDLPSDDVIAKKIFQNYKMTGFISADEQIARLMDTTLESGHSDIVPIGLKKDGGFYSNSKIADPGTFQLLQEYLEALIKNAGLHITSGKIDLNPYENKQGNACTFCDFKAVCQFDPILRENNYRRLPTLKENEALRKMGEKFAEGGIGHGKVDKSTTGSN